MARAVSETGRIELRIDPADKAVLARAAALEHTDVTGFILRNSLPAAREVIERSERLVLSERDSVRVLELLENPPPPSPRLLRAARSLSENDR
jgi:uncharacterized protein (DUF1778 family)